MSQDYNKLKNLALNKYFSRMNPEQLKAVYKIRGPLLILAGAGSGKTTVLINRIANMIYFGDAYNNPTGYGKPSDDDLKFLKDFAEGKTDDGARLSEVVGYNCINPWNILAITFTNKAANELKNRLCLMLGETGKSITAATFHSVCVRILRREAEKLGYTSAFTIYDTDDSRRVIKSALHELDISDKLFPPKSLLAEISHQKDSMVSPENYIAQAGGDYRLMVIGRVYRRYQRKLKAANAMDFDDIILNTVKLFEQEPDVLDHYQNLYKYIMVDEYQDTNKVQFRLISMLADKFGNLCVVGDDDQSIYKFRGATIENILSFDSVFNCDPKNDVIKLERNYRSTQNILTCANNLISNNQGRRGKNLWTDRGDGDKVYIYKAATERTEAKFIADTVTDSVADGANYNDFAVLYRMNAQSNAIEQAFVRQGIPYRVYGGVKFYDRKEIRDIIAYLSVINNPSDMLRLRRIINEPKRGIGEATVTALEQITSDLGETPIRIMLDSSELAPIAKKSMVLRSLGEMFNYFSNIADTLSLEDLLDELLAKTGYKGLLEQEGDEGITRLENINELKSTMAKYEEENEDPSLSGFLEEISLYTDIDNLDEGVDCVVMMTMHSAKGLEFPTVFVVGMEENVFPSSKSLDLPEDTEEERRLAYVAMTRAKKQLYLTYATERMLFGRTERNRVSRFIKELPFDNIEKHEESSLTLSDNSNEGVEQIRSMTLQQQIAQRKAERVSTVAETFNAGDRVSHRIFGEGTVLSAKSFGNDTLLEIAFDSKGTKQIMANFAKIKKV